MSKRTELGIPTLLPAGYQADAKADNADDNPIGAAPEEEPSQKHGPGQEIGFPVATTARRRSHLRELDRPSEDPRDLALTGRERAALLAREGLQRLHKGEMLALFHRVDTALGRRPGRAVLFVAAHSGAGSSSIAHGYGQVATQDRRVLILDAREPQPDEFVPPMSVAAAVLSGCGVADTAELLAPGLYHNLLMAPGMQERTAALVKDERFWRSMVAEFDEVVIDSPAVTESQIGLVMSSRADGVVVVVEAEATRKSQVLRLMEDLHMFHAQVLGTVFNKRTYHMPRWLYQRLA